MSALHYADSVRAFTLVNNMSGRTPLMIAAQNAAHPIVKVQFITHMLFDTIEPFCQWRNVSRGKKGLFFAPDIVSDLVFTRDSPEEGEDTTAVCEWTGSPVPVVTWFKNGEPLDEETLPFRIRITLTNNNFRSELEIQVVALK